MRNRLLFIFLLVALVQLIVPVKMIMDKENVLSTGTEYKFRTEPIDPNDPFRGKYIVLNFDANSFEVQNDSFWHTDEPVYVLLGTDSAGFAKITDLIKQPPLNEKPDYVKAKIRYAYDNRVTIDYVFNKFYMEETKAPEAENIYRSANRDTAQEVYALVNVKEGDAVIKDVMINGVSISKTIRENE